MMDAIGRESFLGPNDGSHRWIHWTKAVPYKL